jgi:hypothetical protein
VERKYTTKNKGKSIGPSLFLFALPVSVPFPDLPLMVGLLSPPEQAIHV